MQFKNSRIMLRIYAIVLCMTMVITAGITGAAPEVLVFAEDNTEDTETIVLSEDLILEETMVIPEGKTVIIRDDGTPRTIDASAVSSGFDVRGKLVILGTSDESLVIKGGTGGTGLGNIATVSGGKLILKSGHLVGGEVDQLYQFGGCVAINEGGSMEMSGGILSDFKAPPVGYLASGVVMIKYNGDFTMRGGVIRDNTSVAGVYALGNMSAPDTTDVNIKIAGGEMSGNYSYRAGSAIQANGKNINLEITDGSFHDNTAEGKGTVAVLHEADVTISGGEFRDNKAKYGGAVAIDGNVGESCEALISGGTYSGNSANSGGAIYVNINGVTLTGGDIHDNKADRWGGGIYVNSKRSILIKNTLITNNTAKRLGGGLWCCPTGGATIRASEGVAIFDNNISETPGAGSDIATVHPQDGNPYQLHLSDRVLGGAKVDYYKDGEVAGGSLQAAVSDARRYNDKDTEASIIKANSVDSYALKAVIDNSGKAAAAKLAELKIYDNEALCGGGIGANGGVFSGYQPPDEENPDTWQMRVTKKWDENVSANDIRPVTVALMINGVEMETVTLSEENNWECEFTNLPDPKTLGSIEAIEKDIDKFIVTSVTETALDRKLITVTLTNHMPPETTGVLDEYEPGEDGTVKGAYESDGTKVKAAVKGASTGDDNSIAIWLFSFVLTSGFLLGMSFRRLRRIR